MDPCSSDGADIEIGIEEGSGGHTTESISKSVSVAAPQGSGAHLPDFTAIIMAEIAAAEAADEKADARGSSLGAGELVLTARELTGLSQRQLAARSHTSQPTIATVESGNRMPTIRTLMKIAQAAGFELVIGLRSPGSATPKALGGLALSDDDGLADYFPMTSPSLFEGPPGR